MKIHAIQFCNQMNCDVPSHYESIQELGRWVSNQQSFKGKNTLHKDRVAKLESIGFVWARRKNFWCVRFEQLVEYKQIHGNCDVPGYYEPNQELGRWVVSQRWLEGKNSLQQDRVAKLKAIGFTFAAIHKKAHDKSDDWDSCFEELRDYLRNHGDILQCPGRISSQPIVGRMGK